MEKLVKTIEMIGLGIGCIGMMMMFTLCITGALGMN